MEGDHAQIFDSVYTNKVWGIGSGTGSTEQGTRAYRWFLQHFLRSNQVRSVVDLGCGDWQIARHMDWSGIDYVGIDVSNVILTTTRQHARPGVSFRQMDATREELPKADLLIVKDVLQHWSNTDILGFLPKLKSYKRALVINGFPPNAMNLLNVNIRTSGKYRPVNLKLPPFEVPGTDVFWFVSGEPKRVFLWQA